MSKSQNGWSVLTSTSKRLKPFSWITGKVRYLHVYTIFDHLCRRFADEVEPIIKDHSWGYAPRNIRGSTTTASNHASATAIDLNAPAHPLGARGTFSATQVRAIRSILAELDGVVRWGGDYSNRADEMHFEIVASHARLAAVVKKLKAQKKAAANPKPVSKAKQYQPLRRSLLTAEKAARAVGQTTLANNLEKRRISFRFTKKK